MAKLNLTDLSNLQNEQTAVAAINSNNASIEAAIENTLSRNGLLPNQMESDFDLNGYSILNADGFVQDIVQSVINDLVTVSNIDPTEGQRTLITPEQFGSLGTYATDGAAFILMSAYVAAHGGNGITLDFMPGKTYKVWDAARVTAGAQNFLFTFNFQPTKAIRIRTNGCTFESNYDWIAAKASGTSCFLFHFTDSVDVDIDSIDFRHTISFTETIYQAGVHLLTFGGACRGVHVGPIYMLGGVGAVFIDTGSTFSNSNRARGFKFDIIDIQDVYYGLNTQRNGDFVQAKIRAINPGRIYFPISSSNHDVDLNISQSRIDAQTAQNVYLVCACAPSGENKLSNLKVRISGSQIAHIVQLQINQDTGTPTAGVVNNIIIEWGGMQSIGGAGSAMMAFGKNDATVYGHTVSDIVIRGTLRNVGSGVALGNFFNDYDWTGENIANIVFENFSVGGNAGALTIDGRAISKNLTFRNIDARFINLALTNLPTGLVDASSSVKFNNYSSGGSSGSVNYQRLSDGKIRFFGVKTCSAGIGATNITFPAALRSTASMYIDGMTQENTGLAAGNIITAVIVDTSTFQINRTVGTNNQNVHYSLTGEVSATGTPI